MKLLFSLPLVFLLLCSSTVTAAGAPSVFVASMADYGYDCKPDFPNPPPMCAKSREVVRDLNKQLSKSKHLDFSRTKQDADLVVEVMLIMENSGKYAVTDRSVVFGRTVILDVDVREIKVKQILTTVYVDGAIDEMFRAKSAKDLRKRLERMYRE